MNDTYMPESPLLKGYTDITHEDNTRVAKYTLCDIMSLSKHDALLPAFKLLVFTFVSRVAFLF
jgi:hypothetical protein